MVNQMSSGGTGTGSGGGSQGGAVTIGLGRSNAVVTFGVLLLLGALVWAGVYGGLTAQETSARYIGIGIGVMFAIPLAMMLRATPRFLSHRYVILDPYGLRIRHGKQEVTLPWQEVYAVGVGFEVPPDKPQNPFTAPGVKEAVATYLADKASEAMQVSNARRIVLEIFPVRPDAAATLAPRLKPYWKQLPPPLTGLPVDGWRFPLPPVVSIAEQIGQGILATQPNRWAGWFQRPWSGK